MRLRACLRLGPFVTHPLRINGVFKRVRDTVQGYQGTLRGSVIVPAFATIRLDVTNVLSVFTVLDIKGDRAAKGPRRSETRPWRTYLYANNAVL